MFTLRVALRYLFSKKTHSAVNVISLISVTGVALASMAIVCVLSVFNGFTDLASEKISQLSPDLRIEPVRGKAIADADSLCAVVANVEGVMTAAPIIEERALAIYGPHQMPVTLKGVTSDYDILTGIRDIVKDDGDFLLTEDDLGDFATLSVGAAISLEAHPGFEQQLMLYAPKRTGRINPANPASSFRADSLLVGGVFQVEQPEYDTDLIIVPIDVTRKLLDYTTEATALEIKADDNIESTASRLRDALGPDFKVKNRMAQQEESFRMIAIEKWITFLLLAFILIIASFNVISTLSMLVIEKDDNIRTLYSLGASRNTIARIFLLEGWLISLLGGVIGIIAGVILSLAQQWGGFIKLGGNHDAMSIDTYPVRVEWIDLLAVLALVALIGWLTSTVTSIFTRRRLNRKKA